MGSSALVGTSEKKLVSLEESTRAVDRAYRVILSLEARQ